MNPSNSLCTIIESPRWFEESRSDLVECRERRNTADTMMADIKNALETIRDTADGPDEMSIDELDCLLEQTLSLLSSTMDIICSNNDDDADDGYAVRNVRCAALAAKPRTFNQG